MLRNEAQQQGGTPLDQDAITAIEETQKAIEAIESNRTSDAVAAIERATGKINILLARNPDTALIPVNEDIIVFDTAPEEIDAIEELGDAADAAVELSDYPAARALLYGLMSEIRFRTYNLPLATYPIALSAAARLMQEKNNEDAATVLTTALNTLVVVDRVTPIPMLLAREAINEAEAQRDKNKDVAMRLVETAREELLRAMELGYAAGDPEYKKLNEELSDLKKQLKNNEDTNSLFARIRERLASIRKRNSEHEYSQARPAKGKTAEPERKAA
jgi:hypothetical protein